jgi:hypothetical protein
MNLRKISIALVIALIFFRMLSPIPESLAQSSMFTGVFTGGDGAAESSNAIIADPDGNMYITGSYSSTCIIGPDTLPLSGSENFFLAKCNQETGFVWARGADCPKLAIGLALTFDNAGSVYVAGYFREQIDFGNGIVLNSLYTNTFIAKYNQEGQILWATSITGDDSNLPRAIAGDDQGNIYITGQFENDIYYGSLTRYSFNTAMYVLKINQAGLGEWLVSSEGSGDTYPQSFIIDLSGDLIMTGNFYDEIIFGSHTLDGVHPGYCVSDIFICKLRADGYFEWATEAGGGQYDYGYSVVCGTDGSLYVNGLYGYQAFFGPFTLYTEGGFYDNDMFVVKMDGNGSFIWAKTVDIACFNNSLMCIDSSSNLYMTNVYSQNRELGPSLLEWYGYNDIYVMKMDKNGDIQWAKGAGSQHEDHGLGIALLPEGDLAITGYISNGAGFDSLYPSIESRALYIAKLEQFGPIAISEINYKSADSLNTGDWVEVLNTGNEPIEISEWTLKDGNDNNSYVISQPATLQPGEYLVLCQDLDKFRTFNPNILNSIGPFGFELAGNGEKIRLFDENELLIAQVYYRSITPWPVLDDTIGKTIELQAYPDELSDGTSWFAGCPGGSPGTAYFECGTAGVYDWYGSDQLLKIYPNPAKQTINITFSSEPGIVCQMTLIDLSGAEIMKAYFQTASQGEDSMSLSVDHLPSGMYFITLKTGSDFFTGKFIKLE